VRLVSTGASDAWLTVRSLGTRGPIASAARQPDCNHDCTGGTRGCIQIATARSHYSCEAFRRLDCTARKPSPRSRPLRRISSLRSDRADAAAATEVRPFSPPGTEPQPHHTPPQPTRSLFGSRVASLPAHHRGLPSVALASLVPRAASARGRLRSGHSRARAYRYTQGSIRLLNNPDPGGLKGRGPLAFISVAERPLSERSEDMPLSDRERAEGFLPCAVVVLTPSHSDRAEGFLSARSRIQQSRNRGIQNCESLDWFRFSAVAS
jgi:hypothetical protein